MPRRASFAGALGQITAAARRLREAGAGPGDLVMVTARTTPEYLMLAGPHRAGRGRGVG